MGHDEIKLGLEIIKSYETWGTWIVSLSITALGALSWRHKLDSNRNISMAVLIRFAVVGSLLLLASLAAMILVGNLKYLSIRWASQEFTDVRQLWEANLFAAHSWLPYLSVRLASATAGVAFGIGAIGFLASELHLLHQSHKHGPNQNAGPAEQSPSEASQNKAEG